MSSWAVYTNSLIFRLKSLMMKFNKFLLKSALRINYVSFLVTLTSISVLNADSHVPTNDFIDLMYSNGFYPLISKPTRITSHSATLIDNISPMTLTTTNLAVSFGLTFPITYLYISDH